MADYSTGSPFIDKAADQADLERKNKIDIATIGAVSRAMAGAGSMPSSSPFGGSQTGAPATTSSQGPTPQQMGVGAQSPQSAFDSFSAMLRETDPSLQAIRARAAEGIQKQFDNPAGAFDQGATIARQDLAGAINRARESNKDELIKTYGANASQVMPAMQDAEQQGILDTRALNQRLTADRATAANQGLNQAIANAMGMTGQSSQERQAAAGLALQASEGAANRSLSREDREDSQAYASAESALGRSFTSSERQAVQAFQQAERMGAQDFASAEAALGRKFTAEEREAIQAYQTSERLSTQDFTRLMTERGYVEARDLDTIRRNHEKELQATGIAADQAKQMADQAHQERLQAREEAYQTTQADLNRKFTTSERIAGETFATATQSAEIRSREKLSELDRLVQERLAQGGWDNASKLQAERLLADAAEAEKTRSQNYLMFSAQMAQEDEQFAKEFGIKREAVLMDKQRLAADLKAAALDLGIKEEAFSNAKVDRAMEMAAYGLEMWNGDNEAALEPFVKSMAAALGEGMGLDPALMEKAVQSAFSTSQGAVDGTQKAAFEAFDKLVTQKGGFASDEAAEGLKTAMKTAAGKLAGAQDGMANINGYLSGSFGGKDYDAAAERLRKAGVPEATIQANSRRKNTNDYLGTSGKTTYTGTPAFVAYAMYTKLITSGLKEADAKEALTAAIGKDLADKAFALEGSK